MLLFHSDAVCLYPEVRMSRVCSISSKEDITLFFNVKQYHFQINKQFNIINNSINNQLLNNYNIEISKNNHFNSYLIKTILKRSKKAAISSSEFVAKNVTVTLNIYEFINVTDISIQYIYSIIAKFKNADNYFAISSVLLNNEANHGLSEEVLVLTNKELIFEITEIVSNLMAGNVIETSF